MKEFIFFCLFSLLSVSIEAQTWRLTNGNINMPTKDDRFQYINPYDVRVIELQGDRYFNDSIYRDGELKMNNAFYTSELKYRFDQIERTVQVKMDNGKEMFLREKDVEYFKIFIDDKTFVFVPESVPNGRKLTLLQVIYKSPTMQLYRDSRKYIFRVKNEYNDGYNSNEVHDEIRKDYRYFFRKGNSGAFKEVKIEAKSFINLMPQKRSQINQLFRTGQTKGGLTISKLTEIMAELDKPTL
jgi:hypothetical protein